MIFSIVVHYHVWWPTVPVDLTDSRRQFPHAESLGIGHGGKPMSWAVFGRSQPFRLLSKIQCNICIMSIMLICWYCTLYIYVYIRHIWIIWCVYIYICRAVQHITDSNLWFPIRIYSASLRMLLSRSATRGNGTDFFECSVFFLCFSMAILQPCFWQDKQFWSISLDLSISSICSIEISPGCPTGRANHVMASLR